MHNMFRAAVFAAAGLALGAGVPAHAQDGGGFQAGHTAAMSGGCPAIDWHVMPIAPGTDAQLRGIAFYSDLSGLSIVSGTVSKTGTIMASLESVHGNGPVGTVTGKRTADLTQAELKGPGCANGKIVMRRYSNPTAGGGG